VMALGGITLEHLPEIAALGFGGAVLLGDVWQQAKEAFIPHFLHLKQLSSHPFNF
jgi:thiamine-phosphate pyrophosphorylase